MAYSAESVRAAWDNHLSAFEAQDIDKILLDYTDASVLQIFNHRTQTLKTFTGVAEIKVFYEWVYETMSDTSGLAIPVIQVTENPKQVYVVWSCPSSGVVSATDTFIFDANNTILRQNAAYTSSA